MSTNKKILFEGQDVNLSSTLQNLQRNAEKTFSSIAEKSSAQAKNSREIVSSMKEEISSAERLARISFNDRRLENAEKYKAKLDEIQLKEDRYIENSKNIPSFERDEYEQKGREKFSFERQGAKSVKEFQDEEVKNQLREQKTTNELLKEILNQEKKSWEQEVRDNKSGVKKELRSARKSGFEGSSPEERAKLSYQEKLIQEEEKGVREPSFFADVLKANLVRDVGQAVAQIPQLKDAYDMIPAMAGLTGGLVGGGMGAAADAVSGISAFGFGLGDMNLGVIGAEMGKQAGQFAGQSALRHIQEKENLDKSILAYRAVTGGNYAGGPTSQFGVSRAEASGVATQLKKSVGTGDEDISSFLGLEKGYGIESSLLLDRAKSTRFTGGNLKGGMTNLLGSAQDQGYERVFFNEIIQTQNDLIKTFSETNEKVDANKVTSTMLELSSLGGAFSLRDPRSSGMYGSVNQGLTNTNDFGKAMNLQVLRQLKPEGSMLDLLEMEEQGLGGEKGSDFLKGTISTHREMFGNNEDLIVLSLKQRFPNIPYQQLRRLAKGEDVLSTLEEGTGSELDLSGQGNISTRSIMQAEISDSWAKGVVSGMDKTKDQMSEIIAEAMVEAMKKLSDSVKGTVNNNKVKVGGTATGLASLIMGPQGAAAGSAIGKIIMGTKSNND